MTDLDNGIVAWRSALRRGDATSAAGALRTATFEAAREAFVRAEERSLGPCDRLDLARTRWESARLERRAGQIDLAVDLLSRAEAVPSELQPGPASALGVALAAVRSEIAPPQIP